MRQPSASSWAPMDDYAHTAREQAKAQLESITGRMFQVSLPPNLHTIPFHDLVITLQSASGESLDCMQTVWTDINVLSTKCKQLSLLCGT